ncbi:MAG: cysteine desulfurase family protein [Oscillospiraceae bacterium]|nr:cysteine desulfurase family protein [Oscillospiraceae bacterium]
MIYLDNSATTKPCPEAVSAMTAALTEVWGNPSSVHSLGLAAEHMVREARESVAAKLGAEPDRVFFTSGGTEADNWAIFSAAERLGKRGTHIVTTAVEHHAVLHPMKKLEERGFEVTYLQPDRDGFVSAEALAAALRKDTILVSVMMVNNESGAVLPIPQMIRATRRLSPTALFHTDAVQGFLKMPFSVRTLGADLVSLSSHKIHGPKGCGALYIRSGLPLPPYLHGGGQEQNYRSGTEATPAIAGFGAACRAADPKAEIARMTAVRDYGRAVLPQVPGLLLLGKQDAPHILSLSLPGLRSQGVINCLQDDGVFVSAGSACAKGHRSHVLEAMGLPATVIDGSIRVSLSAENTEADLDALRDSFLRAVRVLKG